MAVLSVLSVLIAHIWSMHARKWLIVRETANTANTAMRIFAWDCWDSWYFWCGKSDLPEKEERAAVATLSFQYTLHASIPLFCSSSTYPYSLTRRDEPCEPLPVDDNDWAAALVMQSRASNIDNRCFYICRSSHMRDAHTPHIALQRYKKNAHLQTFPKKNVRARAFCWFLTKNDRRNANKSRVNLLSIRSCLRLALVSYTSQIMRKELFTFTNWAN